MLTLPNAISALRFVLAGAVIYFSALSLKNIVVALIIAGLATDVLDGLVARLSRQAFVLGKKIDNIADAVFIASLFFCIFLVYLDFALANIAQIAAIAGLWLLKTAYLLAAVKKIFIVKTTLSQLTLVSYYAFFITAFAAFPMQLLLGLALLLSAATLLEAILETAKFA